MFTDETNEHVPAQTEEETQEETTEESADSTEPSSTDPFDSMTPEEIRAEAKKLRAITNRHKDKKESSQDDVVKKSDFERANESKARRLLEKSDDQVAKEILANWEDLASIYGKVATRGKNSEEDIVEDLRDAHAVWQRHQPAEDNSKKAESDIAALTGTGGSAPKPAPEKKGGIIKKQEGIDSWY